MHMVGWFFNRQQAINSISLLWMIMLGVIGQYAAFQVQPDVTLTWGLGLTAVQTPHMSICHLTEDVNVKI